MKTRKHLKKITALLLVLILAVSSFAFPASAAVQLPKEEGYSGDYTTMQILNSAGWSKIYMHAVNADGDELSGVFPGIEVKEVFLDRIGRKLFIAVIPDNITEIYFNDGGSNRTDVITDFKNGLFKILSQSDGQDYCECELEEYYGNGKTIWLQKHDGWDQTSIVVKDQYNNSYYGSPLDITSYQTYRYTDGNRYYMLTLPTNYKKLTVSNGSESFSKNMNAYFQRFDYVYENDYGDVSERLRASNLNSIYCSCFTKYQYGDVDLDTEISINDVTKIQRVLASLSEPMSTLNSGVSDTDGDGIVTISDATAIQYYLASLDGGERTGREYRRAEDYGVYDFRVSNNSGWDKVFVYAYDADGNPVYGDLPGYLMTKRDMFNTYFIAYVPKDTAKVIFSNGRGDYSTPIVPTDVPDDDTFEVGKNKYKEYYVDITDQRNEEGYIVSEIKYHEFFAIVDP